MAVSGVTDLGGRVLAGRYRLLGAIGSGASGRVYVADDTRLRRQVAVKVLHTALADDAGFLARFRKEAQLAGSLHHPNIVTVYDWGEDDVPFMVLELLRGGSLRNVLDTGARLSPAQAAHVGRQVTDALEYAHGRGLIHRDIKPSNLLFDEHGIVRIADFGLARALAEASFTEPTGSLLGTARYASPEQATGAPLDARSDLYAVSLVLAEAVAGRVPNVADTPIGTLGLRTQRSVLAPEELGPLGAVVERAGQRDPDQRYPDAATMRDGLADVGRHLPPPTPLPLAGLGSSTIEDPNPTQIVGAAPPTVFDQDADIEVITDTQAPGRRRRNWIAPTVLAVALIAVLAGIGALLVRSPAPPVTVPGFVGLDQASATAAATEAGLEVVIETRESGDPAGTVLSQDPAAGTRVDDGSVVTLVVSRGPPPVALPEIAGRPLAEVQPELEAAGFVVDVEWVYSSDVPENIVIGTDPEGMTEAAPESRIVLVVSDGPPPVVVTGQQGKTYEDAVAELEAAGFTVVRAEDYSEDIAEGLVIGTDPGPGVEAPYGSSITVVVSLGPPMVAIPNVIGMTVEEATTALEAVGLEADVSNYRPGRTVQAVSPGVGTLVRPGSTVTLTL